MRSYLICLPSEPEDYLYYKSIAVENERILEKRKEAAHPTFRTYADEAEGKDEEV